MVLPSVLQCFRPIEVVSRDSHPQQAAVSSHPALALARTVVKHDRSPSERKPGHKARWQLPTGRRADSQWRPICAKDLIIRHRLEFFRPPLTEAVLLGPSGADSHPSISAW